MKFEVTILGSSSATPIFDRNPTAQVLNLNEKLFLIDCGEGTQHQMLRFGIKAPKINHIFISHLHGDHYLGLIGLLSSLHLNGRTKPLYLFGPPELKEILDLQFNYSQTELRYPITFHATHDHHPEKIFENEHAEVHTIILNHRIPTTGFLFKEKIKQRKINRTRVGEFNIAQEFMPLLKQGADYRDLNGQVIPNHELTFDPDPPRSYAYCSDTLASRDYIEQIAGADMLYHEATFMHDMLSRAEQTYHTTALQAGEIAQMAEVKQLLIGHFSARYRDLKSLLNECQQVFPNTLLAKEGNTYTI